MSRRVARPADRLVAAMDADIRKHPELSLGRNPEGAPATLLHNYGVVELPGLTADRAKFWLAMLGSELQFVVEDTAPRHPDPEGDFVAVAVGSVWFDEPERAALKEIFHRHS